MRCTHCQLDSPDDARTCAQCGAALSRACARCGFENPAAFKFCGQCAAPLASIATERASVPPPAPEATANGERRRVTVLFCDLVGAAQLSERLDPEDMHRVVRAYQAAAEAVIERHGGHVAQYLGDGLLVYFGYPQEHEGSARSAALAALEIVEAVEGLAARLDAERGVDIAARIGMHLGEGVAGDVGGRLKREQLVMGRAPNIAARLRELAAPGTVLASDAMRELIEDDVELLPLGPRALKGIAEPVGVLRVLWKKQGPMSAPGERVREAPLAGGRAAVDELVAAAQSALAGEGQVALVRGVEGSGKSRLVREVRAALAGSGVRLHVTRCRAKAKLTPLTPFVEVLEKLVGPAALAAALPSEPLTPEARGERTRMALADLFAGVAREHALALVVEDLELADPSSLALFAELASRAPSARLLLCGTFAPPFEPSVPSAPLRRIDLEPLAADAARALVLAAGGDRAPSPEAVAHVLAHARGLPLLLVELGKAAARAGAQGSPPAQDLRAAVLATLAGVGPAREVAWMASVLGPRFERDALGVLCPFDPKVLSRFLERLADVGILAAEEDGELSFSHALVRDAVYEAISHVRRRDAHQKAARALAAAPGAGGAQGAMVAWHLERAGLAEEAARKLADAAREALAAGAFAEAAAMLSRAIDLVTESLDGPRRQRLEVELRVARARALLAHDGPSAPGLGQQLARARELCRRVDAPVEMLHIVRAQWTAACWQGNGPAALSFCDELSALAALRDDAAWRACAAKVAGTTAFYRGRLGEALACLERAAAAPPSIERFGGDLAAGALSLRAWIEALRGARAASLASLARAASLAASAGDPVAAVDAAVTEVLVSREQGDPDTTLDAARRALDLASRQRRPVSAAAARCGLGWALGRKGSPEEGIAEIERGISVIRARGRTVELAFWDVLLAETCLRASRLDAAARALEEATTLTGTQLDAVFKPEVLRLQGDLIAARDRDLPRACALHQRAAETARTYGALTWSLSAAEAHARALAALGRREDAAAVLAAALHGAAAAGETAQHRAAAALLAELAGA